MARMARGNNTVATEKSTEARGRHTETIGKCTAARRNGTVAIGNDRETRGNNTAIEGKNMKARRIVQRKVEIARRQDCVSYYLNWKINNQSHSFVRNDNCVYVYSFRSNTSLENVTGSVNITTTTKKKRTQ